MLKRVVHFFSGKKRGRLEAEAPTVTTGDERVSPGRGLATNHSAFFAVSPAVGALPDQRKRARVTEHAPDCTAHAGVGGDMPSTFEASSVSDIQSLEAAAVQERLQQAEHAAKALQGKV